MTRDTYDMFEPPSRGRFGDNEHATRARPSESAAEICLDFVLHAETNRAILISADGIEARAVWLPKSQAKLFRGSLTATATRRSGQRFVLPIVSVSLPEWLARAKGLI